MGITGAEIGVLGMGTAHWSASMGDEEARTLITDLVDAGGDVLDVSATGPAVQRLQGVLSDAGLRRRTFLSIRSCGVPTRRGLLAELDASLDALGQEHADLWTIEAWDASVPWEEIVSTLAIAVATGRARYVGLAPDAPWHAAMVGAALAMHPQRTPLGAIMTRLSLLDRARDDEVTPIAASVGAGIVAASPLAGGVLTGKYRHATPADSRGASERDGGDLQHYRGPWSRPVIDGLVAAAEGLGVSPASAALAWARDRPGVTCVLVGARTPQQWRGAVTSLDVRLPGEISVALDEVSLGATATRENGRV